MNRARKEFLTPGRNPLLKTEQDFAYYRQILDFYYRCPSHFETAVRPTKFQRYPEIIEAREWLRRITPGLDSGNFRYKWRHRLVWLVNGLTGFPKCPTCGKRIGFEDNMSCWSQLNPLCYKDHCDRKCAGADPENQKKVEAGVLRSLGVTHAIKVKSICDSMQAKGRRTYMEKTGYDNVFKNPAERAKRKATWLKKYAEYGGVPSRSPLVRAKARATIAAKTQAERDAEHIRRATARQAKNNTPFVGKTRYSIDGLFFDSSWECYVYLWNRDSGRHVERPDCGFEYECGGKTHVYFPDFRIDGKYVEVKGDHFFSVEGDKTSDMWYPYNRNKIPEERLRELDSIARAKQACMRENGVEILVYADIRECEKYVREKYGADYVKNRRTGK